jgi:hypothetical protein
VKRQDFRSRSSPVMGAAQRQLKRTGKGRLSLNLAGPGVVELAGKKIKQRKKHTAPAGVAATPAGAMAVDARLSVAPQGNAKRRLHTRGRAKVRSMPPSPPTTALRARRASG